MVGRYKWIVGNVGQSLLSRSLSCGLEFDQACKKLSEVVLTRRAAELAYTGAP